MKSILSCFVFLTVYTVVSYAQNYTCQSGSVRFKSDAPLELIQAKNSNLKAIIDPISQGFAFSIDIDGFQGFNSPLQREHFIENYMDVNKHKSATFTGKMIDKIDFTKPGKQSIRVKGKIMIHGVSLERILRSDVEVKGRTVSISSNFSVLLADHNISIPKLVFQKIAEEIQVSVEAIFIQ